MKEYERKIYPYVEEFLRKKKENPMVLIDEVKFPKIKEWKVDVVGFRDGELFAVEVKKDFSIDSVFSALKQAEFYNTFSSNLYVCFPKKDYIAKDKTELKSMWKIFAKIEG